MTTRVPTATIVMMQSRWRRHQHFHCMVTVSLERLCGFVPRSPEEAKQLTQQVVAALSQDDNDDTAAIDTDNQEHDSLSRHFDSWPSQGTLREWCGQSRRYQHDS